MCGGEGAIDQCCERPYHLISSKELGKSLRVRGGANLSGHRPHVRSALYVPEFRSVLKGSLKKGAFVGGPVVLIEAVPQSQLCSFRDIRSSCDHGSMRRSKVIGIRGREVVGPNELIDMREGEDPGPGLGRGCMVPCLKLPMGVVYREGH